LGAFGYVGLGWFCVFVGVWFLQASCVTMCRVLSRTRVQFPCKLLDFVNVDVIFFCTYKLACNCKNFYKQP
jgi:hypothetical protein